MVSGYCQSAWPTPHVGENNSYSSQIEEYDQSVTSLTATNITRSRSGVMENMVRLKCLNQRSKSMEHAN